MILQWNDKRDVLTLSKKHTNTVTTVHPRENEVHKPDNIIDYNNSKAFIDSSDEINRTPRHYAKELDGTVN